MIFNINPTPEHQKLMPNDLHIFVLPGNKIRLGKNEPVFKELLVFL